jgi:hypothetical protein
MGTAVVVPDVSVKEPVKLLEEVLTYHVRVPGRQTVMSDRPSPS